MPWNGVYGKVRQNNAVHLKQKAARWIGERLFDSAEFKLDRGPAMEWFVRLGKIG